MGVGLFNDVSQIPPRPPLVAMAAKFEVKLAITRHICETYPIFLHLTRVLGIGLLNDVGQILPRPTLVAMATKFG